MASEILKSTVSTEADIDNVNNGKHQESVVQLELIKIIQDLHMKLQDMQQNLLEISSKCNDIKFHIDKYNNALNPDDPDRSYHALIKMLARSIQREAHRKGMD